MTSVMAETVEEIDPGMLREVMGHYPTGVAVVTGRAQDGELLAMVVGTFSSVSLDPPLVSFMPMKTSRTFERLRTCESLCINILGGGQEDLVSTIARRKENKFEGLEWFPSSAGNPVLEHSVAWIDTQMTQVVEAGDHWIALCAVRDMNVTNPVAPLIFFQGGYGSFVSTSLIARMDHELADSVQHAECARTTVEELAGRITCEVSLLTAVSRDEMAVALSAVGPGVNRAKGLAHRIPLIPPLGDTYVSSLPPEEQDRWIRKAQGVDEAGQQVYRDRLAFVREHGYLLAFLPAEGTMAYDAMNEATRKYAQGRLTPAKEREIRDSIIRSRIDYGLQEIDPDTVYTVASLVVPVRGTDGTGQLTLRLAQLPETATGEQVQAWVQLAQEAARRIEEAYGVSESA